ncbi:hypothetical protein Hanom_Chr02g00104031 [Helianthus anomalus]
MLLKILTSFSFNTLFISFFIVSYSCSLFPFMRENWAVFKLSVAAFGLDDSWHWAEVIRGFLQLGYINPWHMRRIYTRSRSFFSLHIWFLSLTYFERLTIIIVTLRSSR